MPRPHPFRRRLRPIVAATSGLAIGIAGIGVTALPATATSAPQDPPGSTEAVAGSSHSVTLITGDRVTVTDMSDGTHTVDIDTAVPGAGVRTYEAAGELHVLPEQALPYLASGALDPDLFNVSLLIEYGYDDASADATPLIVEQASSVQTFSAPLPGLEVTAALPSIDGAAAALGHDDSAAAWSALTAAAPSARSLDATPGLAGGIEAIHLDGKVRATLDSSVDFIDAPEAWADGHTGEGVTVAVLDTGYDDTHPDLQGRVRGDSKSFVPDEEVAWDPNGHGTHVASTIAGTGAASEGTHRGVADGAELLVGKVLDQTGWGQDSWIIEAMEWAGQNAPIVSMSLGSPQPSDGKDVMAEALNQIAEETGSLFVVAAGNAGSAESIGAPGSAEQAFTVGSVDDPSGDLSYFSSQGPLPGSGALKPNVMGPGNDVTAARSADSGGEGAYIGMSGTSMATPHVAGAAAILLEANPDYTTAQLKAALASTAIGGTYTPYQGGTGVIDVDAALESPVIATGSGDFGMLSWGEEPTAVEQVVEYTNRTDAEITVSLEATLDDTTPSAGGGEPGPLSAGDIAYDALTMDATELTIPAGEARSVSLTVDPAKVPAGTQLSGALVGSVDGEPVTRTALGTIAEAERYDLTLTATDFDGNPASTYAMLWNEEHQFAEPIYVEGETTLRLLEGDYAVLAFMELDRTPDTIANVVVGDPAIDLSEDVAVALDARGAKPVSVDVGDADVEAVFRRMDVSVGGFVTSAMMAVWVDELWAQPMDDVDDFVTRWRLWEPMLTITDGKQPLDLIQQAGSAILDDSYTAVAVDAGTGGADDFARVDAEGKIAVVVRSDDVTPGTRAANAVAAGARLLLVVNDADRELSAWAGSDDWTTDAPLPVAAVSGIEGRELLEQIANKKKVKLKVAGAAYADTTYDIAFHAAGEIPAELDYRPEGLARVETTYHGQQELLGEWRSDFVPGSDYSLGAPFRAQRGSGRTEWVNSGDIGWRQNVTVQSVGWEMRDRLRTYTSGEKTTSEYFGGIVRPNLGVGYWSSYRVSDYTQVNIPSWADGGDADRTGTFDTWMQPATVQQLTDVYIDGELVKHSDNQGTTVFALPDGEQEWRVVNTATHDGSHLKGSTRTVSEWTFRSEGYLGDWTYSFLPMISAYYDVDVNAENIAGEGRRKGSAIEFGLELGHVDGTAPAGAITEATLEARTAGGKWTTIALKTAKTDAPAGPVEGRDDIFATSRAWVSGFSAQIPVSDQGGWVDLRVTATDAAGNTFSQEIEKAFEVAPAKGARR
ncbi:S8 family serine peptidase [Microbacterium sp. CPCC 204701]|uniref:S8 family serine peptidase n=1 Tax=Microbacterium sp. CPCC 204701 TaxID=2493084 RepID=UPI000FDA4882|nr:S8 family serine peptidase [Microbacterium sp. CPCC 204701]